MNKIQSLLVIFAFVSLSSFGQSKKWNLEECVNYALQNNISIKQSMFDNELTDITKKDAIGRFLPSANANASHSWSMGSNINPITNERKNQTTQFTSVGLNVGLDIYRGMQNQNQLRKANLSKIASQYQLTKMQEDVSLNVVNAYLQILFNKENLKVQKEQLVLDTKQLNRTIELVEAGVVAKGDLLDVKATLATDNQRLITAENTLLLSKLSLGQLLQLEDFKDFDIADEDIVVKNSSVLQEDPTTILNKAKETRTELKLAQTNLQLAEKDIQIAKGAYQPTLQAFYGFNTSASNLSRIVTNSNGQVVGIAGPNALFNQFSDNKGHNFGAQLSIPIFNGFATRNTVDRSKVALEKSKLALDQQELELERTVYTAFTDTKGAQKSHESATATLEARQNAMEYAKERYGVSLQNLFGYHKKQHTVSNAQSERFRTRRRYVFGKPKF